MNRILVVDDEKSIRLTLTEFLRRDGYEAEEVGDAKSAKALLDSVNYDVVIADIIMPGMTGIELLDLIKSKKTLTQVIIITGEPTLDTATDALRKGAIDYLVKPINKQSISRVVRNACELVNLAKEKKRLEEINLRHQEHLEELVEEQTKEIRTAYKNLEQIQLKHLGVLRSTPHGLCILNQHWLIEFTNHSMNRIFFPDFKGGKELTGLSFKSLFAYENDFEDYEKKLFQKDKRLINDLREVRMRRMDDSVIWCEISTVCENPHEEDSGYVITITDITIRKMAESIIKYRSDMDRLISRISTDFINMPIDKVESMINRALKDAGEFVECERAYFFKYNESEDFFRYANEWHHPDIPSLKESNEGFRGSDLPWVSQKIKNHEIVNISSVDDIPVDAVNERAAFRDIHLKSTLFSPIYYGNSLKGIIGFSKLSEKIGWNDDTIDFLKIIGNIFANALEHKHEQETLLRNEAYYRGIVEDQTELICRFFINFKLSFANEAFSGYFEKSMFALSGIRFIEFIDEEYKDTVRNAISSLTVNSPVVTIEVKISINADSNRWNQWTFRAIPDETGNIAEYQAVGRDITKLKNAEEVIRKSRDKMQLIQNQYQAVLKSTPNGLCIISSNWIIIYVNHSMGKILNHSNTDSSEILGIPFGNLFIDKPAFEDYHHDAVKHVRMAGEDVREIQLKRLDESLFWCELTLVRTDPGETAAGYVATLVDITDRKNAQKNLQESERRFRDLLENISLVDIMLDKKGVITFCNSALLNLTGWKNEEVIGVNWFERFIPPDRREEQRSFFEEMISGNQIYTHYEEYIQTCSGDKRLILWNNTMLHDQEGNITGTASIGEDITLRRKMEIERHTFANIGTRLAAATSLESIITIIREESEHLFNWDNFFIAARRIKEPEHYILSGCYIVEGIRKSIIEPHWQIPESTSAIKKAFAGRSLLINNLSKEDAAELTLFGDQDNPACSLMFNPIVSKEHILGIISVQSNHPEKYGEDDMKTMKRLANLAAHVLERVYAESSLKISEERYSLAMQGVKDGVWDWDLNTNQIYFSPRWKTMLGYSDKEIGNEPAEWFALIHPDDKDKVQSEIANHIESKTEHFECEFRILHKNSTYKWALSRGIAIRDNSGKAYRIAGSQTDITERKNAELLRTVFAKLGLSLSETNNVETLGKILADALDELLDFDAYFFSQRITGSDLFYPVYALDIINGRKQQVQVDPAPIELYKGMTNIINGAPYLLNREMHELAGNWVPFGDEGRRSASLMFIPIIFAGHIWGILSVQSYTYKKYSQSDLALLKSIGDSIAPALRRIQAESELRESEEKYRLLIENVNDGIVINQEEKLIFFNQRFLNMLGYDFEDLYLRDYVSIVAPESMDTIAKRKETQNASGKSSSRYEMRFIKKDNSLIDVEASITTINYKGATATFEVVRDITERKQAEKLTVIFASLGQKLSEATTPKETAIVILNAADEMIGWDSASFGLLSEDGKYLSTIVNYDIIDDIKKEAEIVSNKIAVSLVAKRTIKEGGQLILRDDPSNIKDSLTTFGDTSRRSMSMMFVPIKKGLKTIGILSIHTYRKNAYTNKDLHNLMLLADHCSGALERTQAEASLAKSEERYALAAKGANDGLWDWNLKDGRIYFSPRWKSMLGYNDEEISDSADCLYSLIHPEDLDTFKTHFEAHINNVTEFYQDEYRIKHKDGSYRVMLSRGLAVRDLNGRAYRIAGSQTDITERKTAEEQLLRDAFYDTLTNLPNRALFLDRLGRAIQRTKRVQDYAFAVLFIDLDRFKNINDSMGHFAGDQLLMTIARKLEKCIRPTDTVARLGGDEFTIFLEDIKDDNAALRVVNRIYDELAKPLNITGKEIFASASIGIALSSTGYEKAEDILRDADTAMYQAKGMGKACHVIFNKEMHYKIVSTLEMETNLRKAIEREEFCLFYQPIINLKTGNIRGFEALIRWRHKENILVQPSEFIPLAEETGLVIPMGRWVLKEACSQMHKIYKASEWLKHPYISVNVSGKWFMQESLPEQVGLIVKDAGFNPELLILEITESAIMENAERAINILTKMKKIGVKIAIDDFGTGYSSLSYLHRFSIDILKIDRSFVSRMIEDKESLEIAKTILNLTENLKMKAIAEGIETEEQLEKLRELKCDFGQGYYFSKPKSFDDILKFVENNPKW